jgi:hypothetical protein
MAWARGQAKYAAIAMKKKKKKRKKKKKNNASTIQLPRQPVNQNTDSH